MDRRKFPSSPVTATALSSAQITGANDRIRLGVIGHGVSGLGRHVQVGEVLYLRYLIRSTSLPASL
jgi:hypothetical protein